MLIGSTVRKVKKVELTSGGYPIIFTHVGVGDKGNTDEMIEVERAKIAGAISLGTDVICDVSMAKNLKEVHPKLMEGFDVPFGVVTAYECYIEAEKDNLKCSASKCIETFKEEVLRGFDIITIHATVFKNDLEYINQSNRIISTTSRGGMLMLKLMETNGYENPFYTHFDEILKICKDYEVALSLGPCYRPASVCDCDANDILTRLELERMAVLVKKANEYGVGIAIEGIGHAPLNKIPEMINLAKSLCDNAVYRVMTVATDVALGYDHIASAISSAMAIYCGADSITCVTRSEHIGIPSLEEVLEGVKVAKVAAHSGWIARTGDLHKDEKMSKAREKHGCIGHIPSTLFPDDVIKTIREKESKRAGKSCTMCGDYCPLNRLGSEDCGEN